MTLIEMSKGYQITIPAKIRNKIGLRIGSKLDVSLKNRKIIIKTIGKDLEMMFKKTDKIKPKHNLTPKQMDELNEGLFR